VLAVVYHGVPLHRTDPSLGSPIGWITTPAGSYTRNEPNGTSTWLPSNDHPSDKAIYRVRVNVPEPYFAVANGAVVAEERAGGRVATTWEMPQPMASSEVQIAVGPLARVDSTSPAGATLSSYVTAGGGDVTPGIGLAGQMLDFYSGLFGPYPFTTAGLIATDAPAGLAVDAQSRPLMSAADLTGPPGVRQQGLLSTALAHQWFGAAVTPARWQDVWLSEGFATYARWLWMEQAGLQRVDDAAANALARTDALRAAFGPPDAPSADTLFSPTVLDGGAVVLQALRQTVGDAVFFAILRTWVTQYGGQSVTTDTFIDHASRIAGEDLTGFFMTWLSATDVPDSYPTPPG
jgi:aminopeptidase N